MNRRKSMNLIGLGSLFIPNKTGLLVHKVNSKFLGMFSVRWKSTRLYTFEILGAMPESALDFQPNEDMMSFGKLFTHIGYGLEIYAGKFDGLKPREELEGGNKTMVTDFLENSFNRFAQVILELKESDLYTTKHVSQDEEPWKSFTVFDIIMLAYNHTIHHQSQATTYLRLKEIIPPQYRF